MPMTMTIVTSKQDSWHCRLLMQGSAENSLLSHVNGHNVVGRIMLRIRSRFDFCALISSICVAIS